MAASAWSGGKTTTIQENGEITTYSERTISGIGFGGDIGTIAFGTIVGGAGSLLAGGNFWQGAATGLVVSGLNHSLHSSRGEEGSTLYSRRYAVDKNGNIISESLNYFDPKKPSDANLLQRAESESLKMNELTVYSHGHPRGFAYSYDLDKNGDISRILYRDSAMWRNFIDGKTKSLIMVLKACTTGSLKEHNISQILTNAHKGLTIYAPAQNWTLKGNIEYTQGGKVQQGWYNIFKNGEWTKNGPINIK